MFRKFPDALEYSKPRTDFVYCFNLFRRVSLKHDIFNRVL